MTPSAIDVASVVALSGLDGMTPLRLRMLVRRHDPQTAVAVARGEAADSVFVDHLVRSQLRRPHRTDWQRCWREALDRVTVGARYERFMAAGVGAVLYGDAAYPECLVEDPEAPSILFYRGDLDVLDGRRVGIVGTRNATATGRRLATGFGLGLAERGVRVVSGLARGIDGYAHRGALAAPGGGAPPVGVVACGLDVVYPREHRDLWAKVGECGVLLSERPPGTAPRASAFPERNRILAALSELVVVVESRSSGGSLLTAREAAKRDITVMAVPGSLASRASEGTNELLRDGLAVPALDATDVLVALGLDTRRANRRRFDPRPPLAAEERALFDLIGGDAVTLEELALRSCQELVDVALSLGRMEAAGWVVRSGGWFEALPAPSVAPGPPPATWS